MAWGTTDMGELTGRTAVVTGANGGIGRETARAMAARGARVVLACRNAEKAQAARAQMKGDVRVMVLDLSDLDSIASFVADFTAEQERLDLLVNNAGVMMTPYAKTADGFELQIGTNHLGHFALTAGLLEMLRDRQGARVVTVASHAHWGGRIDFHDLQSEKGYGRLRAYAQSKLANLLFAYELERRLRASGARAISVASHPGWTESGLYRTWGLARFFSPLLAMSAARGALTSLRAATAQDVSGGDYIGPGGPFGIWGAPVRARCSARSRDEALASRLWDLSRELTGARFPL